MTRTNNKRAVALFEQAEQRAYLYGFLATVYRDVLTVDMLRQIRCAPLLTALVDAGVTLNAEFLERPEEQLLSDLAVEYTWLFAGPGRHISPHESIHREDADGSLWSSNTTIVQRFIEGAGFTFRDDAHPIPDHISIELEFMQSLAHQEAIAWRDGRAGAAMGIRKCERKFLDDHLLRWVPRFCTRVAKTANEPFYTEMAGLTREFISSDKFFLGAEEDTAITQIDCQFCRFVRTTEAAASSS